MKKTLILKSNRDDFEKFFLEHMQNDNCVTMPYYNVGSCSKFIQYLAIIWMEKLRLPFASLWYDAWKKNLNEYEQVILFDRIWGDRILDYIHKKNPNLKILMWLWNPVNEKTKKIIDNKNFVEFWSFDDNDCKKYNLRKNVQFYFRMNSKEEVSSNKQICFVGADKGRIEKIKNVQYQLHSLGYITDFQVLVGKRYNKFSNDSSIKYLKSPLKYAEIINIINNSFCILDITQEGQEGLTLRALEALFFEKKLITFNSNIKNQIFYNENNIFVIKENNDVKLLEEFLKKPYAKINDEIKQKYLFDTWLKNFDVR